MPEKKDIPPQRPQDVCNRWNQEYLGNADYCNAWHLRRIIGDMNDYVRSHCTFLNYYWVSLGLGELYDCQYLHCTEEVKQLLFPKTIDWNNQSQTKALGWLRAIRHYRLRTAVDLLWKQKRIQDIIDLQRHKVPQNPTTQNAFASFVTCIWGKHHWKLLGVGMKSAYGICQKCMSIKEFPMWREEHRNKNRAKYIRLVEQTQDPFLKLFFWASQTGKFTRREFIVTAKELKHKHQPPPIEAFRDYGNLNHLDTETLDWVDAKLNLTHETRKKLKLYD